MTRPDPHIEVLTAGSPIDAREGAIAFCGVYLVEAPDDAGGTRRMVVDTGHAGRRHQLLQALDRRGLAPAAIDAVVLSHTHWDHIQNIDLFPDAEIIVSGRELDSIAAPSARDLATPAWTRLLFTGHRVTRVEPGDDIARGVTIVDAAGHTPGSTALAVRTATDETSLVTGDALPNAVVATRRTGGTVFWDVPLAQRTVARLADIADVVYPGHDRPFRLAGDTVDYLQPVDLTLLTTPTDHAGTEVATLDLAAVNDMSPTGPHDRYTAAR